MNKTAMKNKDLLRLFDIIDSEFKEYSYNEIAITLVTALLYSEHLRVQGYPDKAYTEHMSKASASIVTSIMSSLAVTILHNIPQETVH